MSPPHNQPNVFPLYGEQFPPLAESLQYDEDEGIRAFVRGGHDWLVAFGFGFGFGLLAVVVPAMVIAEWVK
jgi:hypothetical protein